MNVDILSVQSPLLCIIVEASMKRSVIKENLWRLLETWNAIIIGVKRSLPQNIIMKDMLNSTKKNQYFHVQNAQKHLDVNLNSIGMKRYTIMKPMFFCQNCSGIYIRKDSHGNPCNCKVCVPCKCKVLKFSWNSGPCNCKVAYLANARLQHARIQVPEYIAFPTKQMLLLINIQPFD